MKSAEGQAVLHPAGGTAALLRELVAHLRQNRTDLREEWARRITEAKLLTAMSKDEIFAEATSAGIGVPHRPQNLCPGGTWL